MTDGAKTGLTERGKAAIELLGAIAGLGVYVTLVGGLVQWSRLAVAGLPADVALGASDARLLFGTGLRALLVLPAALALALVVARLLSGRDGRLKPGIARGVGLATVALLVAVSLALMLVYAFGRLRWPSSDDEAGIAGATAVALFAGALGGVLAARALAEARRRSGEVVSPESIPLVERTVRRAAGPRPAYAGVLLAAVLTLAAVLAATAGEERERWLALLALAVATVPALLLAWTIGARLLRRAESPGQTTFAFDIGLTTAVAVVLFIVPAWLGLLVAGLAGLLVWRDPESLALRVAVGGTVLALASVALQARMPVTFERLTTTVDGHFVHVAYLGEQDGEVVVAACQRQDEVDPLGRTQTVGSVDVAVFRVDAAAVRPAQLRSEGYAFYSPTEPSVASAAADFLGIRLPRPPSLLSVVGDEPANVCGRGDAARQKVSRTRRLLRAAEVATRGG